MASVALGADHAGWELKEALKAWLIDQGGVRLNGEKVSDKALSLAPGEVAVLQVGKRKFARVTLA